MKRRTTQHKQAIFAAFADHHLLSAAELGELVPAADSSTIYRNLARLTDDGILASVEVGGVKKYELADKHDEHDHFVCKKCEDIKAIYLDDDAIKAELPTSEGFSVTVRGLCKACA